MNLLNRINKLSSLWKLTIAIVVCEATGIVSAIISNAGMNAWFQTLKKPSWNPPAYLFGPVWTALYALMGISFWLVWTAKASEKNKTNAYLIFGCQLFFNFWWSILFFKYHSPSFAFVDIILLVITILLTIFAFAKFSKIAAWLLVPYISWVTFASFLNYTIWFLNRN